MISIEIIHEGMTAGKANMCHPVRNNLETLDSVEVVKVVKTIREALKR